MAPVEPSFLSSNAGPLTRIATESSIEILLLSYIGSQIYKSHRTLTPAQHTRRQHKLHRRGLGVFLALAAASLALNIYFWTARRVLSYYQWAEHNNERAPGTLWGGRYESGKDVWLLDRWLSDTNLNQQRLETILASSKAWWYAQQQMVGSLAFTAYLGIEGRRRNFNLFYILAFALVSSQIGLSLALNLFFVAVMLAPETTSPASRTSKDSRWAFHRIVQLGTSLVPMALQLLTPRFPSALLVLGAQRHFGPVLRTAFFLLTPKLSSALLGRVHTSARVARRSYVALFSSLSLGSLALYLLQSFIAISDSLPKTSRHWHLRQPKVATEAKNLLQRFGHAVFRIVNVPSVHPVIAEITWDIVLTIVTLCAWTIFRDIDLRGVARNSLLPWLSVDEAAEAKPRSRIANATGAGKASRSSDGAGAKSTSRRKKPSVISVEVPTDEESDGYVGNLDVRNIIADSPSSPGSTRRSVRERKVPAKAKAVDAFRSVGESVKGAAAAATTTTTTSKKKKEARTRDSEGEAADADFKPSKEVDEEVSRMVAGPEHGSARGSPDEVMANGETVAVEWGLFIVGGLGAVAAGVLGADV